MVSRRIFDATLQGVAVGALATIVIGFGWGGWMLGGSAEGIGGQRREQRRGRGGSAVVADNLTALKKADSGQQAAYVEKGGWASMPRSKAAESGVSQARAAILSAAK